MGKNKENISPVKRGMNRNTAPYLLQGMEYLFALNTNIQDDDTSVINITNEESNVLATKFKDGFKVIGKKNDILSKGTYFFLVNPETEQSELGIIKNNQVERTDILDDLEVPLQEVDQEPYQEYATLINKGLNLNINYPVKKIVIKNEQCGKVIAFTDDFNPPRLIILDKLENYLISDKEVDPEKIAIFKKSLLPKIKVNPIVSGGRLKRGTYEFMIAYTNKLGEEISEYTSITNPIPIFDKNNRIMESSEISDRTNFAIKLKLENLDQTKDYYKVVVIQNTDIEGGVSFFEEGIHPISDDTVIYSTEENKVRTSLDEISRTFPYVKKWEGLTETKGHLVGYGITAEKEINLQPIFNLMGSFLKWQTSVGKESLYESGDDVSTSKGYMRNETYPFSGRVVFDSGYKSALFPFISRPAEEFTFSDDNTYHELDNVPDTKDSQSIYADNPAYADESRTKFWQFYNTASYEDQREIANVEYTTIQEPVTKTSLKRGINNIPQPENKLIIKFGNEEFTNLEDFLEDNRYKWEDDEHPLNFIFDAFNVKLYEGEDVVPEFDECTTPELLNEEIEIGDIENPEIEFIERNIGEYIRVALDTNANIYEIDSEGGGKRRDEAEEDKPGETESARALHDITKDWFFEKIQLPTNNERQYAIPLNKVRVDLSATHNTTNLGYYNDSAARYKLDDLLTDYKSIELDLRYTIKGSDEETIKPAYTDRVSINALWFRDEFEEDEDKKILEIPKYVPQTKFGEIGAHAKKLRVTIYNDCTDEYGDCNETEPIMTIFVDPEKGFITDLVKSELQEERKDYQKSKGLTGRLRKNKFLLAVDTPIASMTGTVYDRAFGGTEEGFMATGFNGKYAIHTRPIEYGSAKVMFDNISLDKRQTWRATCNFNLPHVDKYEVVPYKFGKFAYTESNEKYPDNKELYDSTSLRVDLRKIPDSIKDDFKRYFIKNNPDGSYELNENADFTNKPIRHFKFPDNDVAPFMSENDLAAFTDSLIFPIGIHIEDEVFSAFLDIAVDNDLLTQEQRDSIIGYEIFRGDRTLEKSIEAKGLLYDNYQVEEENETVYFPNFPFNTLGENNLLYKNKDTKEHIPHPYDSESNNSFSFISPDNQYRKLSEPSELQVEGYQFGNSKSYFADVEEHPDWVILGKKAYQLANTLATAETIAEIAIQIAEATIETSKNYWFMAGVSSGGNPVGGVVGSVATGVIAGFQVLSNSIFKVARYRNEWLTTFKNLGQPHNFASYSVGTGHYNSLISIPSMGNTLRAINTIKEVNSGRFSFRHNDTGKRIVLNNKDREKSSYIYLGEDFNLDFPSTYRYYDNYEHNPNYASRTIASEEGACTTGQSREIISNVASPYVSLKNYIPSQYGAIDAIKWLPTSYISYFDGNQDTIFGGDIFISRMTLKRKMPLFMRDAMKVPSLTPFNYNFYSNVGSNRFYCNYEVSEEINLESSLFPDFKSEYEFDCTSGTRDFYVTPPSKFYLYYYGIVDFLVESEINNNFRYGKKDYRDNFYPNTGDIVDWTQERNVSIKEPNTFYYNFAYSRSVTPTNSRTLPFTYSKEEYDCRYDSPNGAMWSLPDNSEKDMSEPWLIYRPYDFYNFPTSLGKLKDLKGIENNVILGRFENQSAVFNKVDTRVEGIDPNTGGNSMFQRVQNFRETDLGYLGTKTVDIVSTEYGHFFPDTERGQIFRIDSGGGGMEEISKYSGGKPNGMDKWFRKHLPFKVYNPMINNYEDIDVDNAFNGIGITMGWDAKSKRVFITKKDYIPLKEMNYENRHFFAAKDEFELITDYESDGYTYLGKEDYDYKFHKPTVKISDNSDIFVVINVNDYTIDEAREIVAEVKDWAYDLDSFNGEIVVVTTNSNRWLRFSSELISDSVDSLYTQGEWRLINTYNGQSIDKEGIVINFINSSAYGGEVIQFETTLISPTENLDLLQVNRDSIATYVDDNGIIQTAESNEVRVDYSTGEPKILIEEERTNLWENSEKFTGGQGSHTIDTELISPSGLTEVQLFIADTTASRHRDYSLVRDLEVGKTYTISCFFKAQNHHWVQLVPTTYLDSDVWANFNLQDGTIGSSGNSANAKIEDYGNGWYRCSVSGECIEGGNAYLSIAMAIDNTDNSRYPSYTLDEDQECFYLWGAQVEEGLEVSSYIPTIGSPITREEDIITVTTPERTVEITEIVDGTERTISSIPNTYQLPIGNVDSIGFTYPLEPIVEPTNEFISDYKNFMSDFDSVDYLKTIIVSKDNPTLDEHINNILKSEDEYKDFPIQGTNPQLFIERLSTYGISHTSNFEMNTEKALNEVLGDEFDKGVVLIKGDIIDVTNTDFFKDVSWTIAYQVETGSWLSYYSFEPNYYIGHNTYFQSGINNQEGKEGVWSHGMSNKSYGVFYGDHYPWTIEYPIKNEYRAKRLQNITFWTEAKRPINDYDFAYDRDITFNKAVIYNNHDNSGQLNLVPQKTLSQISKYPITREDSQDILITHQDYNWTFNNIYDRTLNQDGRTSAWITDENEIDKTINHDLVQFGGKKILSYLRGDYFIVRLTQDNSTEHDILLKWSTNQEEIY